MAWKPGLNLAALRARFKPEADITVYNGFPVSGDVDVEPGDRIYLIRRGEIPDADEMRRVMIARHSPDVYDAVHARTVGIAGAGGLGSAVAIALARLFVGRLIIADFDVVEPSNLNRQQYFVNQVGMPKVEALRSNLEKINPYIRIDTVEERVNGHNIARIFKDCDVLAECFDDPEAKSELVEVALSRLTAPIVAVSGIAGYSDIGKVVCRQPMNRLYVIGDGESAACAGHGLMAPKVGVAAHLQANKILELLLERAR